MIPALIAGLSLLAIIWGFYRYEVWREDYQLNGHPFNRRILISRRRYERWLVFASLEQALMERANGKR